MIKVTNAYENNLKNISLAIPKNKITTFIGVSGSGKSTIIYNVLASEASRREKIDKGKANCLDYSIRAKFESIDNLPYAVTLKQRGLNQAISSTVATVTQIHDLLRKEFVKKGKIIGDSGVEINPPTEHSIIQFIEKYHADETLKYFAVVSNDKHIDGKKEISALKASGIKEAVFISSFDNKRKINNISSVRKLNEKYSHTILVEITHLHDIHNFKSISFDSYQIEGNNLFYQFDKDYFDIKTGKIYQKISPQLLSFNSRSSLSGRCTTCNGHGIIEEISLDLLFSKKTVLNKHFVNIPITDKGRFQHVILLEKTLKKALKDNAIDCSKTFFELEEKDQKVITDILFPKIYKHKGKPSIGKFISTVTCPDCKGSRFNEKANAVHLYQKSFNDLLSNSIDELSSFFRLQENPPLKILSILTSLKEATLGYLPLTRTTDTLSGGELQRLKFSIELNSPYNDLLYILDEPSTGLHPYNNQQMISLIKNLRDKGNTVVISEHDHDYIKQSDYIFKLGPGSGNAGGEITYEGKEFASTNKLLSRKKIVPNLCTALIFKGVHANNIINEDFVIPLNCLVAVSGVSGSGKSSFIHKVVVPSIKQYLADQSWNKSLVKRLDNASFISNVVELTQSQIGLNSRSIVATYLSVFDVIRNIYAEEKLAQSLSIGKSHFSFNSNIGACTSCNGLGEVEGHLCPNCLGNRYKPEVLAIKYKNLTIIDLLSLPVERLKYIFNHKKLDFAFGILEKLGLSHLSLGRTTPTLSGGEGQRLKLAKTLIDSYSKLTKGGFLLVLDEPTSGLSSQDVANIYKVFDELLSFGNSVIVIEHNLDVLKNSDYIIDIGLGSGKEGGKNIFSGSFDQLLKHQESLTAKALRSEFKPAEIISHYLTSETKEQYSTVKPKCHPFYFNENHFSIEKEYAKQFNFSNQSRNLNYARDKRELLGKIKKFINGKEICDIFFSPYTYELYTYKKVPLSIKKRKILYLKKLGFQLKNTDYQHDEWSFLVSTKDIETAYNFGNGWVVVIYNNQKFHFSTRLISFEYKIIGSPSIDERTFNIYLNSCQYCNGENTKNAYNKNLIISDDNKSILDKGFFTFVYKRSFKRIVNKFRSEELFDFTKPFNALSEDEKNIFLYGFREYKFLKNNGNPSKDSDYIEWKGLYSYVYHELPRIKIANKIKKSQHEVKCPFCDIGINKEVDFYTINNTSITDLLKQS